MKAYLTLVRRELGSFFGSLTGYILIATVLLLLGLSFVDMLVKLGVEPTDAPATEQFFVTVYFWLTLLLTTPVMTMRLFAPGCASFCRSMSTCGSKVKPPMAAKPSTWCATRKSTCRSILEGSGTAHWPWISGGRESLEPSSHCDRWRGR